MNLFTKVSADEDDFPWFSTFIIIIPIDCKIIFFFFILVIAMHMDFHNSELDVRVCYGTAVS